MDDLKALAPTVFCAVPRLLTRLQDRVQAQAEAGKGLSAQLLAFAIRTKLQNLESGRLRGGQWNLHHSLFDSTVLAVVKRALGLHQVRLLVSGGAPLPAATLDFFRVLLGPTCDCREGYGQTETAGCTTVTPSSSTLKSKHWPPSRGAVVGVPITACEVRLVDVPEMGYRSTDKLHGERPCRGRGEIWVRGPCVFAGYLDDPQATAEVLTEDGWLRSGDIGNITSYILYIIYYTIPQRLC